MQNDPKIVAIVERWLLFNGHLCYKSSKWDLKMVAIIDRCTLFGGGRKFMFDCNCICCNAYWLYFWGNDLFEIHFRRFSRQSSLFANFLSANKYLYWKTYPIGFQNHIICKFVICGLVPYLMHKMRATRTGSLRYSQSCFPRFWLSADRKRIKNRR